MRTFLDTLAVLLTIFGWLNIHHGHPYVALGLFAIALPIQAVRLYQTIAG